MDSIRSGHRRLWSGTVLAVLTLLIGGAGTAVAARIAVDATERHVAEVLDRRAESVRLVMAAETLRYTDVLTGLTAAAAQPGLTQEGFTALAAHVGRRGLPGLTGVSYVISATTPEVAAAQRYWRAQGNPELVLSPLKNVYDHRFSVLRLSIDNVPTPLGLDLAASEEGLRAMDEARATGTVAASRTYVLLKDRNLPKAQQQLSFVLAAPVLARDDSADAGRVQGWLLMALRGRDFLTGTLTQIEQNSVNVSLADGDRTVATMRTGEAVTSHRSDRRVDIPIGGRRWTMTVQPTTELMPGDRGHSATFVLIGGLTVTVLLAVLLWVLATSRNRALRLVEEATVALRGVVQEQQRLAVTDSLTGLHNRRYFQTMLDAAVTRSAQDKRPLAVVLLDLDHFKRINDTYGHPAGDAVLIEAAQRIRHAVRSTDVVARYGGEEFVILLAGAAAEIAVQRGERIRHLLRDEAIMVDGIPIPVTASIGVAAVSGTEPIDPETVISDADRALYRAKTTGRDRLVLAGEELPRRFAPSSAPMSR